MNPGAYGEVDAIQRELGALTLEASRLRRDCAQAKTDSVRSARALLDVEAKLALANSRVAALEELLLDRSETASMLSHRLERAEQVSAAMHASLSWQVTAPLRALKRRV